jgi:hypothetical protein
VQGNANRLLKVKPIFFVIHFTMLLGSRIIALVNNEAERIWKEAAVSPSSGIFAEGGKTTKNISQNSRCPDIIIEPNTCLQDYRYTNLIYRAKYSY